MLELVGVESTWAGGCLWLGGACIGVGTSVGLVAPELGEAEVVLAKRLGRVSTRLRVDLDGWPAVCKVLGEEGAALALWER